MMLMMNLVVMGRFNYREPTILGKKEQELKYNAIKLYCQYVTVNGNVSSALKMCISPDNCVYATYAER